MLPLTLTTGKYDLTSVRHDTTCTDIRHVGEAARQLQIQPVRVTTYIEVVLIGMESLQKIFMATQIAA